MKKDNRNFNGSLYTDVQPLSQRITRSYMFYLIVLSDQTEKTNCSAVNKKIVTGSINQNKGNVFYVVCMCVFILLSPLTM